MGLTHGLGTKVFDEEGFRQIDRYQAGGSDRLKSIYRSGTSAESSQTFAGDKDLTYECSTAVAMAGRAYRR